MEDVVLVLFMLFVLVMASFMLDRYSCMIISQSGFALIFGLVVGLLMVATGRKDSLHRHMNLSNNLFFDVLLPPIIYEGGFSIKRQAFFRNFPAIMSTAVLGTVIATCVTGGALYLGGVYKLVTPLSWVEAFLFGSLISAVDPVATLACFNKLNAPPLLFNLVFGESVLNDAVAIALYQTLAKWEPDIDLTAKELLSVALNTGGMFLLSLWVSMVITLLGAFLLKRKMFATLRYFPAYEISLCLIFSLMTYFVADSLNLSGIVALFFSGTMTAHYHFHTISKAAQHAFTHLLHTLAFICENIVYLFMGTSVVMLFAGRVEQSSGAALRVDDIDWKFIGLTILACVVARFLNIFPLLGMSNCFRSGSEKISVKFMSVIWFAGLRGSIAFALAKTWNYKGLRGRSHHKLIESTTLMVVLFTTIVIGGLTGPFLSCLGLTDSSKRNLLADSDTSSTTDSPPVAESAEPRQRSPSRVAARPKTRGSMHYPVSSEVQEPPRANLGTEAPEEQEDELNPRKILTPRPQFRDSDEEADAQWAPPTEQPPAVPRQGVMPHRESYTGAFFRTWQQFDVSYLRPVFGGEQLARTDSSSRHSMNQVNTVNQETLSQLQKEHEHMV
ncbi:hypothetical protein Poli38472_000578 [Pythium oligandrum]|uniref:Sodium/hydrogen exchanger n=1 Tax=Pythium oligandrum TaxID=41045 RepID=A0A8K1CCR6_PYTOL|nr:hypothetical protein Poli38472_000578 [Pythium oligandrum]|eukprot:TMW60536.1 hypothetical protein Poli38472_000578 [Pythium oligandrum]